MNFIKKCSIKCWYWFIGATIGLAWILMVVVGYMMLYPFNPITFNDEVFPILTKEVRHEEPLVFEVDSCKHMDLPAEIQVSYVDGIIFDTQPVIGGKSVGCEVVNVSQVVPDKLPHGEYQLRIVFNYRVNHFRTVSYTKFSESFELIE